MYRVMNTIPQNILTKYTNKALGNKLLLGD